MPKHSLIALIGFAKSAAAAATTYTDQFLAESANPEDRIATVNALCDQVVATDREARALQTQAKAKVTELRRLKRELYNQTSSLVDMGVVFCGKRTPQGQEFATLRTKLRRRRSPQRAGGASVPLAVVPPPTAASETLAPPEPPPAKPA